MSELIRKYADGDFYRLNFPEKQAEEAVNLESEEQESESESEKTVEDLEGSESENEEEEDFESESEDSEASSETGDLQSKSMKVKRHESFMKANMR